MAEMEYKEPDEIFCPECGRTIKRDAAVVLNVRLILKN